MNPNKSKKRTKLRNSLLKNQNLIIRHIKQEWEEADNAFKRQKRKDQLIQFAKDVGVISGKTLLTLLLAGGVLTIAVAAPNIFAACGRSTDRRRYFKKDEFNKNKYYLRRRGLIEIKKRDSDYCEINLTKRGICKATEEVFNDFDLEKSKPDGNWRVVMFDIPKKYNWARDAFRQKLRDMGFNRFQESVFITPYPCEKEIDFIVSVLDIRSFVYLIKTKDFLEDRKL